MLRGVAIELAGYTASFRVPGFLAYQLTLPLPPLSSVYGLLSAARGDWVTPTDVQWLAYTCDYATRAMDLEAIVTFERPKVTDVARPAQRNVIRREFLVYPRLTLYLPTTWDSAFRHPRFPLLLGRSQDVASVEAVRPVELSDADEGEAWGTLLPLHVAMESRVPGLIHNLPIAFGPDPERRLLGVHPFTLLDAQIHRARVSAPGWLLLAPSGDRVIPVYRREWVESLIRR